MNTPNNLGIWMDHASAHLTDFSSDPMETTTIESNFTHQVKQESLSKSESLMHQKEQHQQAKYYNALGDVIKEYDAVVLFGPTNAKVELFNLLRKDFLFSKIQIDIKPADKMTETQQQAFVRDYFAH